MGQVLERLVNVELAVIGVDGQRNNAGMIFLAAGVTFAVDKDGFVPVWLEGTDPKDRDIHHLIGKAKLSVHDGVVWAECEILDDKLPASLLKNLFPHICGKAGVVTGNTVRTMSIEGVNLSSDQPLDPRVGSLATQGVKPRKKG